jgi:site-specific DNA-methyltransferase (adenine-specific)
VNTQKIRRFPVVSEVCVHYVFEPKVDGLVLKNWLLREWKRTGLPVREANKACGVADAAVRKYLDQGHLWYWPPVQMFERLVAYANQHGKSKGRPYFSKDGKRPMTGEEWSATRSTFKCPHGFTNIWNRPALRDQERVKTNGSNGKAVHLNQKPLDLMRMIIEASSEPGDVVWEPFGGMFSASIASRQLKRKGYAAEIDSTYFHYGLERVIQEGGQLQLP